MIHEDGEKELMINYRNRSELGQVPMMRYTHFSLSMFRSGCRETVLSMHSEHV